MGKSFTSSVQVRKFLLVDAFWTPQVNYAIYECQRCNGVFNHRLDRRKIVCTACKQTDDIFVIREQELEDA